MTEPYKDIKHCIHCDLSGFDTVAAELEGFAAAINGITPYPVTSDQAIHGCSVIEAIVESAEKGIPVQVK